MVGESMKNINLLIVDDEAAIRNGLKRCFEKYEEITGLYIAENGVEALDIVHENDINIILCDINIPLMNGLELCKRVYSEYPDIKIIFISGYDDFQYAQEAIECRAMKYLLKPVAANVIIDAVKEAINEILEHRASECEYQRLRIAVKNNEHYKKEQLFNELLAHKGDGQQIVLNINENEEFIMIVVVSSEFLDISDNEDRTAELNMLFEITKETLEGFSITFDCLKTYDGNIVILINECSECKNISNAIFCNITLKMQNYILVENSEICRSILQCVSEYNRLMVKNDRIIDSIKQFVNENLDKDIGLQTLAEHINMNPNYLSVYFKKKTKIKFSDFVMKLKVERAKELILKSDLRMYEIAEMVGYKNQRYFSVFFRKMTGLTPSEFKTKHMS